MKYLLKFRKLILNYDFNTNIPTKNTTIVDEFTKKAMAKYSSYADGNTAVKYRYKMSTFPACAAKIKFNDIQSRQQRVNNQCAVPVRA